MREETYFEDQSTSVHELHIPDMDLRFKHPSQMLPKESAIEKRVLYEQVTCVKRWSLLFFFQGLCFCCCRFVACCSPPGLYSHSDELM